MSSITNYTLELNATLMICTAVLYFKYWITTAIQSKKSMDAGTKIKEDSYLTKGEITQEKIDAEARWRRIVQNDLENIPLGLIIFWSVRIVIKYSGSQFALLILMPIFVFGRIMHTIFFGTAFALPRSLSYMIAVLAVWGAAITGVVDVCMALGK